MSLGGFNPVDIAILVILLVSGLLALFRGLVKEVLSILGWVAAALATLHLYPLIAPWTRKQISYEFIANASTVVGTFIAVMIVISLVVHLVSKRVSESRLGPLDRSLGFVFGLLRGSLIVCIAYMVLVALSPPDKHPEVIREARALPLVIEGSALLVKVVPEDLRPSKMPKSIDDVRKQAEKTFDAGKALQDAAKAVQDKASELGYKPKERGLLDQLFDSAGKSQ